MSSAVKISIAVCTYNGAAYITEQLESFSHQTWLPDELVICDDRSTDETVACIEAFAKTAPFPVTLYRNEQVLRSTKNFEKALSLCTGDLIFLSDQDDVWLPGKIEAIANWFAKYPEMYLVFSDGFIVDEHMHTVNTLWQHLRISEAEKKLWEKGQGFQCLVEKGNCVMGMATAIRRELLPTALPFSPMNYWIHDGQLALRAALLKRAGLTSDRLVQYRQHQQQQVGIRREKTVGEVALSKIKGLQGIRADETLRGTLEDWRIIEDWAYESGEVQWQRAAEDKVRHLQRRYTATRQPFFRRLPLLQEWIRRRYKTYSSGRFATDWVLLVKDIFGR